MAGQRIETVKLNPIYTLNPDPSLGPGPYTLHTRSRRELAMHERWPAHALIPLNNANCAR